MRSRHACDCRRALRFGIKPETPTQSASRSEAAPDDGLPCQPDGYLHMSAKRKPTARRRSRRSPMHCRRRSLARKRTTCSRRARSNSTMRRERGATSTSARLRLSTVVPTASTTPCLRISNVSKRILRRSRRVSSVRRRPAESALGANEALYEEIPIRDEERVALEGDAEAIRLLVGGLDESPAGDGRTPPEIRAESGPGCHRDRASASARRDATSCDVAVGSNTSTLIP